MFAASFERWALQSPPAPDMRRNRSDASRYCDWLLGWEAGRGQSVREAVAWDRHELRASERPVHIGFARLSRRHGSTYGAWIKLGHLWHWHWQSNSKSRPARDLQS
jgi:hypothetical protein